MYPVYKEKIILECRMLSETVQLNLAVSQVEGPLPCDTPAGGAQLSMVGAA
jgi:hypothetical protein